MFRSHRFFTVVGFVFTLFLGMVMSAIWHGETGVVTTRWLAELLPFHGASIAAMPEPPDYYFTIGRFTVIPYLLIMLLWRRVVIAPQLKLWGSWVLIVAVIGDLTAYWLSAWTGVGSRAIGFWYLEVPSLLVLILGCFAWAIFQRIVHQKNDGLVLSLPMTFVFTAALQYLPYGFLLALLMSLAIHVHSNKCAFS